MKIKYLYIAMSILVLGLLGACERGHHDEEHDNHEGHDHHDEQYNDDHTDYDAFDYEMDDFEERHGLYQDTEAP